ncbi:MAG: ArdC family protein [Gallionellaceae bacterium]
MQTDSSLNRGDLYTRVTNEIIKAIEAGVGDFHMPWHRSAGQGMPRNAATKSFYQGINTIALWSTSTLRGYTSPYWATYRQWNNLGAHVRRGEKASTIIFFKKREPKEGEEGNEDTKPRLIIQGSVVFNADQVEGWEQAEPPLVDRTERLEAVDVFISSLGATIRYGGDMASYSKAFDRINMPESRRFFETETSSATESFYSVLLHEHVHWTGHAKRLNRDLSGRFGTSDYAMEELVAELGAAFLCADLGISVTPRMDHAVYIRTWLVVLRQEKAAIITASSAAMAACRYMRDLASKNIEGRKAS